MSREIQAQMIKYKGRNGKERERNTSTRERKEWKCEVNGRTDV